MKRSYIKSRDFPIHALVYWWVLWLSVSLSDLNEFLIPSYATVAQFAVLILSFLAGHFVVKQQQALGLRMAEAQHQSVFISSFRMQLALRGSALTCAAILMFSLQQSGAFTYDFIEYFARLRQSGDSVEMLTGSRYIDVLTKIFVFPMSYTVIAVLLATGVRKFRYTLTLCIINLLGFSYLWQVNYPLLHLFWFFMFYLLLQARRKGSFDIRGVVIMAVIFLVLLASAANRFGGDLLGGLQRYVVGYHLLGFSFYDYQYQDPNSILHAHTFGRSSLGFLDQMVQVVLKMFDISYQAASSENATFNDKDVDIGRWESKQFNAFGTILFGFYRDLHLLGILVGGFCYGALTTHMLYKSKTNWTCGALFLILASSWMMGMMVNPIEQAYFWFSIITLILFAYLKRGFRQ